MQSYLVNDFLPTTILREADNGNLVGKARIARVGVQKYLINGELCNVLRDPQDVEESLPLFDNLPLTLNHPTKEDGEEVNSNNSERLTVGYGSRVTFIDGWLETDVNIVAKRAKDAAKTTHQSFSNGYKINLIPEQGVFDGIPYQYKQKIIAGNHIALVPTGTARAGLGATFVADSVDIDGIILDSIEAVKKEQPMYNFKDMSTKLMDMGKSCGYNDMVEVEIGEEKYPFPKDMGKMMDMFGSYMSDKADRKMQDSVDFVEIGIYTAAQNEIKALDSKVKQLNEANGRLVNQLSDAQSDQRINDMFAERTTAYDEAKSFLGENVPFSPSVSAVEWKKKALNAKKVACDGFTETEVNAAFAAIKAVASEQKPSHSPVAASLSEQLAAMRVGDSTATNYGAFPSVLPQHRTLK